MASLDRHQWIDGALTVLIERGVEAVRVEPLAKRLGVTKGSFYWHFAARAELLEALLDGWEQLSTLQVIEAVEAAETAPRERLRLLTRRAFAQGGRADRAIRAWASHDSMAAAVLQRVDERRLSYVEALFVQCGLDGDTAKVRARMLYTCLVGEPHLAVPVDGDTRVAYALDNLEALLRAGDAKSS